MLSVFRRRKALIINRRRGGHSLEARLENTLSHLEDPPGDFIFQMHVRLAYDRGTLVTLCCMLPPVDFLELIIISDQPSITYQSLSLISRTCRKKNSPLPPRTSLPPQAPTPGNDGICPLAVLSSHFCDLACERSNGTKWAVRRAGSSSARCRGRIACGS